MGARQHTYLITSVFFILLAGGMAFYFTDAPLTGDFTFDAKERYKTNSLQGANEESYSWGDFESNYNPSRALGTHARNSYQGSIISGIHTIEELDMDGDGIFSDGDCWHLTAVIAQVGQSVSENRLTHADYEFSVNRNRLRAPPAAQADVDNDGLINNDDIKVLCNILEDESLGDTFQDVTARFPGGCSAYQRADVRYFTPEEINNLNLIQGPDDFLRPGTPNRAPPAREGGYFACVKTTSSASGYAWQPI